MPSACSRPCHSPVSRSDSQTSPSALKSSREEILARQVAAHLHALPVAVFCLQEQAFARAGPQPPLRIQVDIAYEGRRQRRFALGSRRGAALYAVQPARGGDPQGAGRIEHQPVDRQVELQHIGGLAAARVAPRHGPGRARHPGRTIVRRQRNGNGLQQGLAVLQRPRLHAPATRIEHIGSRIATDQQLTAGQPLAHPGRRFGQALAFVPVFDGAVAQPALHTQAARADPQLAGALHHQRADHGADLQPLALAEVAPMVAFPAHQAAVRARQQAALGIFRQRRGTGEGVESGARWRRTIAEHVLAGST
ncbi:hypothetical protein XCM_11660 [Xanthomonas citri pv. mangiferaeindicae]|nr:hypothetical protein XCM_11660 [Xanthomonas citri pv. mangiferaeindicae]